MTSTQLSLFSRHWAQANLSVLRFSTDIGKSLRTRSDCLSRQHKVCGRWKKCYKLKYFQNFAQGPGYHFCVDVCVWLSFTSLFVLVQLLSPVWLLAIPWTATHQAFLSSTISRSLHRLMSIESVMPSNHLILCCPLLLLPSIFPSIRVFSNESALCNRWPNIGASATVLPMNIQGSFLLGLTGLISLQSKGLSRVFCSTTIRKHQLFGLLSLLYDLLFHLLYLYFIFFKSEQSAPWYNLIVKNMAFGEIPCSVLVLSAIH